MTFNDFIESIENQYTSYLPFVVYRKPRENQVNAFLQQNNNLYLINDYTEKGFVFAPFDNEKPAVLIPSEFSESLKVSHSFSSEIKSFKVDDDLITNEEKSFHLNLVNKAIETIKTSELDKVVISRKQKVSLTKNLPFNIYKSLLQTYPQAFVYCWYHPKVGLWLGATPETLIKIEGNQFSIMALAGTQVYKENEEINWGAKEYKEQQIVTDFIIDSLKPLVENISVSNTETIKAGNLLHLKTMVSAKLKSTSNLQGLISAIHPTPAVCGLPKLLAKQFILENENYNRTFYTGYLGELNLVTSITPRKSKRNVENRAYSFTKNSTKLYVNLRCMELVSKTAIIYVGGGITESSDATLEWEETVSKSLIIKNIL